LRKGPKAKRKTEPRPRPPVEWHQNPPIKVGVPLAEGQGGGSLFFFTPFPPAKTCPKGPPLRFKQGTILHVASPPRPPQSFFFRRPCPRLGAPQPHLLLRYSLFPGNHIFAPFPPAFGLPNPFFTTRFLRVGVPPVLLASQSPPTFLQRGPRGGKFDRPSRKLQARFFFFFFFCLPNPCLPPRSTATFPSPEISPFSHRTGRFCFEHHVFVEISGNGQGFAARTKHTSLGAFLLRRKETGFFRNPSTWPSHAPDPAHDVFLARGPF